MTDRLLPWHDPLFKACALAGPLTWAALAIAGLPRPAGHPPVSLLVTSVLVAPLLEEWVFRGQLQGWLLERAALVRARLGISGANLLTSLTFSAAHLWSQSPANAASVLLPSLVLGVCRERYDAVAPGMALHMFWNAGFVWLFARG